MIADALNLIEARDRIANVVGVIKRLLSLFREGELLLIESIAMFCVEFGHGRAPFAASTLGAHARSHL
jgi:hypothetical protein